MGDTDGRKTAAKPAATVSAKSEHKGVDQNGHRRGPTGGQLPQAAAGGIPAHLPPLPLPGRQDLPVGRLTNFQGLPLPGKGVGEGDSTGIMLPTAAAISGKSSRIIADPSLCSRHTARFPVGRIFKKLSAGSAVFLKV